MEPYKLIGFGAMEVTTPYKLIGFGAMEVTKPYNFIGFGAMEVEMYGPVGQACRTLASCPWSSFGRFGKS